MRKILIIISLVVLSCGKPANAHITREKIITNAIEYIEVEWYCTEANINHPEYIQYGNRPCDFSVGWYTGEAYSYGGNDNVPTFLDRIARGDGAGSHLSHYTAAGGTPWWATGIDCSAFVSRCWEISRQSTRTLPNYSTEIARNELLMGDILNIPANHVRLFDKRAVDGRPIVYEASGSATKCVHRTVDWGSYTPRRFNDLMIAAPQFRVENLGNQQIKISWNAINNASRYQIYFSTDGITFSDMGETADLSRTFVNLQEGQTYYFRIMGKNDQGEVGIMSEVLGTRVSIQPSPILIVNGFDRMSTGVNTKNYIIQYAKALDHLRLSFDSCSNETIILNQIDLKDYSMVIWILGEESTADHTFTGQEQSIVRSYLENGGQLFVSGAEIGWDLDYYNNGLSFYRNYLKASYIADDANVYQFSGVPGSIFEGLSGLKFDNGTHGSYDVDWPDCIEPFGGSQVCLNYDGTSYHAAIQYEGTFGSSFKVGKLVYFGFPFETIYPESGRNEIMERIVNYFGLNTPVDVVGLDIPSQNPDEFRLFQNFPNPFNSSTAIRYHLPPQSNQNHVQLIVYNLIGEKVRTLINEKQAGGTHLAYWDGKNEQGEKVSSGVYLYQLKVNNFVIAKRLSLIE
jgi:hypothetical protein